MAFSAQFVRGHVQLLIKRVSLVRYFQQFGLQIHSDLLFESIIDFFQLEHLVLQVLDFSDGSSNFRLISHLSGRFGSIVHEGSLQTLLLLFEFFDALVRNV